MVPLNQRAFDVFLSHSSQDKSRFTNKLNGWLVNKCGLRVWYDPDLPAGQLAIKLNEGIENSRTGIIVLSQSSRESAWVETEYSRMQQEAAQLRDFRLVTVRIDDVEPFGLLKGSKFIDVPGGELTGQTGSLILESLFGGAEPNEAEPIYISRGWRADERDLPDKLASVLQMQGLRLFGDSLDQIRFDEGRIKELMTSASGFVAILPHRGEGKTSSAILREIKLANALGLASLLFRDERVLLNDSILENAHPIPAKLASYSTGQIADELDHLLSEYLARLKPVRRGRHVFVGHSLEESIEGMFATTKRMLSRLSGLPVKGGALVAGAEPQGEIVRAISEAEFALIDITNTTYPNLPEKIDFALNSCIEAGIALGAGTRLYLTKKGPRRSPPFMFRNIQVWHYDDAVGFAGVLRQISLRHRRLVL
jgi:hypothetical protein